MLRGDGPSDVRDLTVALARIMVELVDIHVDPEAKLDDGSAYEVYRQMIQAQGGDPEAPLPTAAIPQGRVASMTASWSRSTHFESASRRGDWVRVVRARKTP